MVEEDMTDAMIARLMAEEYGGDQDYEEGGADDSDDPDYGEERKKKGKKGGGGKRGRKPGKKAPTAAPPAQQPQPPPGHPLQAANQLRQPLPQALQVPHVSAPIGPGGLAVPASLPQLPAGIAAIPAAAAAYTQQHPTLYQNDAAVPAASAAMHLPVAASAPAAAYTLPAGISMQQAALMGAFPLGLPLPVALAPAPIVAAPVAGGGEAADNELSATGRRKRKDTGKQRQHSRSWTEDEERLFQEALELHGRDWKKCADHVGTRDHRAFTSHAQKHFIKLLLRGEEVPPKVAETGRGYTLSGKPLDPNSASAFAYGLKPDLFEAVCRSGRIQVGVHVTSLEMSDQPPVRRSASKAAAKGAGAGGAEGEPQPKRQRKGGKGKARAQRESDEEETDDEDEAEAVAAAAAAVAATAERTEYARSRPRRDVGQRAKLGETTESLELTSLQEFVGPPGTGAPAAQPFTVTLDSQALLVADFHAHLSRCEVIGLLGGTFDADQRAMVIKEAFPCKRVAGSDSGTSVELDAESQVEATSAMEERGLIPVGWYHSHPIFEPRPSAKDNENQRNYQALCRDPQTGLEPWVGLIVGPYDQALESPSSRTQLWVVKMHNSELTPFNIRHAVTLSMPGDEVQGKVTEALEQLQEDVGRVDLSERWRGFSHLTAGQPDGEALTNVAKLRASLAQHMPRDQPLGVANFLDSVTRSIEATWGVTLLKPAPAAAAPALAAAAVPPAPTLPVLPAAMAAMPPAAAAVAAAIAQHAAAVAAQAQQQPKLAPSDPVGAAAAVPANPPEEPTAAAQQGAPPLAQLQPGAMSALLGGAVGDHGGLVITAAHHQLLMGGETAVAHQ